MTKKTEPVWTESHIKKTAAELYERYYQVMEDDPETCYGMILTEFCFLQCKFFQLQEAFEENHKVSSGAYKSSHKAVELYQQLESSQKIQAGCFSKRLEKLEK